MVELVVIDTEGERGEGLLQRNRITRHKSSTPQKCKVLNVVFPPFLIEVIIINIMKISVLF